MAQIRRDVTDAELAVLQVLWDREALTIRDLTEELYPDGGVAHYATVQKLLERLEKKGCVTRTRRRRAHVFAAAIGREELIGHRLQAVADKLCEGSLAPLLTHLVKGRRLTREERRALRQLVSDLDQRARRRRQ